MGVALVIAFKFYTSVAKWLKLKVRKIQGVILTFVEVTGEKLVRGPPPSWIGLIILAKWVSFMPAGTCQISLSEKFVNTDYFWFTHSSIRTEYGYLQSKSTYSVQIWKNSEMVHFSCRVKSIPVTLFTFINLTVLFVSLDLALQHHTSSWVFSCKFAAYF